MPLQLKITSEHKHLLGDDSTRTFSQGGGTIGRALDNDWILPDPDRFIESVQRFVLVVQPALQPADFCQHH